MVGRYHSGERHDFRFQAFHEKAPEPFQINNVTYRVN
jgi:hypothetical protein